MTEVVAAYFDVRKLSAEAIVIMKTALCHACMNKHVRHHVLKIDDFFHMAKISRISMRKFSVLINEVRKSIAIIEVIDTGDPQRDDLPYFSWRVFKDIRPDSSNLKFEVDPQSYNEMLQQPLAKLK